MNPSDLLTRIERISGNVGKKERERILIVIEDAFSEHAANVPATTTSAPLTNEEIALVREFLVKIAKTA